MRHEYIHLSQNDPRWKDYPLGTVPNLGLYGCLATSYCVLSSYYGHDITPDQMSKTLLEKGLFVSGDLISNDNDLSQVFPDITYTTSYSFPNVPPTPANLTQLQKLLEDINTSVIVMIDLGNGSAHFSPVIDCDGTRVTLMNTWTGQEQDFASVYGDPATKILKYVVYHGNAIASDPLVCDRASVRNMLVTKASRADDFSNHGYLDVASVIAQINALQTLNTNLQNQIDILKSSSVKTDSLPITTDTSSTIPAIPPVSPQDQSKPQSFWQTDISSLFKLFTKRGGN